MTMWQWDWVVRKIVWERCVSSLGFSGLVLLVDMSPSTKKNVASMSTTMTTMWQWDRVVRKVIWEERCVSSLGFSGLYC